MKFNLVDDPWIRVIGKPRQSLKSFFSDLTNTGFCGNAVEKIAMLRFMLSLTHAAVEIPDEKAWHALTPEVISEKVLDYLEKHRDCFELFGERPFLQFPQLRKYEDSTKIQQCNTVYHWVSSGNNKVLTHWNLNPNIVDSDLPLLILCYCGMAKGDKRTDNSITLSPGYNGKMNDKGNVGTGKAGVLLGKNGYLHSYLFGKTFLDTIHLNLITEEEIKKLDFYSEIGRPAWENMPVTEDCQRAKQYKRTYQGMLLPLDKFFLLFPESQRILVTDGIDYSTIDTGLRDPALTSYFMKNNQYIVEANMSQRPWRELPALLAFLQTENKNPSPLFLSAGIRKLPGEAIIHVWTAGLQISSNSGEQHVTGKDDYIESDFYFPNNNDLEISQSKYCHIMEELKSYAKKIYDSVYSYSKAMHNSTYQMGKSVESKNKKDKDADKKARTAEARFWETMEKDAQMIIDTAFAENVEDDSIPEHLKKRWLKLVMDIYNQYCPRETSRQLLAWSEAKPFAKEKSSKKGK